MRSAAPVSPRPEGASLHRVHLQKPHSEGAPAEGVTQSPPLEGHDGVRSFVKNLSRECELQSVDVSLPVTLSATRRDLRAAAARAPTTRPLWTERNRPPAERVPEILLPLEGDDGSEIGELFPDEQSEKPAEGPASVGLELELRLLSQAYRYRLKDHLPGGRLPGHDHYDQQQEQQQPLQPRQQHQPLDSHDVTLLRPSSRSATPRRPHAATYVVSPPGRQPLSARGARPSSGVIRTGGGRRTALAMEPDPDRDDTVQMLPTRFRVARARSAVPYRTPRAGAPASPSGRASLFECDGVQAVVAQRMRPGTRAAGACSAMQSNTDREPLSGPSSFAPGRYREARVDVGPGAYDPVDPSARRAGVRVPQLLYAVSRAEDRRASVRDEQEPREDARLGPGPGEYLDLGWASRNLRGSSVEHSHYFGWNLASSVDGLVTKSDDPGPCTYWAPVRDPNVADPPALTVPKADRGLLPTPPLEPMEPEPTPNGHQAGARRLSMLTARRPSSGPPAALLRRQTVLLDLKRIELSAEDRRARSLRKVQERLRAHSEHVRAVADRAKLLHDETVRRTEAHISREEWVLRQRGVGQAHRQWLALVAVLARAALWADRWRVLEVVRVRHAAARRIARVWRAFCRRRAIRLTHASLVSVVHGRAVFLRVRRRVAAKKRAVATIRRFLEDQAEKRGSLLDILLNYRWRIKQIQRWWRRCRLRLCAQESCAMAQLTKLDEAQISFRSAAMSDYFRHVSTWQLSGGRKTWTSAADGVRASLGLPGPVTGSGAGGGAGSDAYSEPRPVVCPSSSPIVAAAAAAVAAAAAAAAAASRTPARRICARTGRLAWARVWPLSYASKGFASVVMLASRQAANPKKPSAKSSAPASTSSAAVAAAAAAAAESPSVLSDGVTSGGAAVPTAVVAKDDDQQDERSVPLELTPPAMRKVVRPYLRMERRKHLRLMQRWYADLRRHLSETQVVEEEEIEKLRLFLNSADDNMTAEQVAIARYALVHPPPRRSLVVPPTELGQLLRTAYREQVLDSIGKKYSSRERWSNVNPARSGAGAAGAGAARAAGGGHANGHAHGGGLLTAAFGGMTAAHAASFVVAVTAAAASRTRAPNPQAASSPFSSRDREHSSAAPSPAPSANGPHLSQESGSESGASASAAGSRSPPPAGGRGPSDTPSSTARRRVLFHAAPAASVAPADESGGAPGG